MTASGSSTTGVAVPVVPYGDVLGARDWLCAAFGFTPSEIVTAPDGSVVFAQVVHGSSTIVLSAAADGGRAASSGERCYVLVNDIDAHYARAIDAGALLVSPLETTDQGRGYSCRDPAGQIWSFGTFDPRALAPSEVQSRKGSLPRFALAGAVGLVLIAGSAVGGALLYTRAGPEIEAALVGSSQARAERDVALAARASAESAAEDAKADLLIEQAARARLAAELEEASAGFALERESRERLEAALSRANDALANEREAGAAAVKSLQDAQAKLAEVQAAAAAADRNNQAKLEALVRDLKSYKDLEKAKKAVEARLEAERSSREAGQKANRATLAELASARDELAKAARSLAEVEAKLKAERSKREAAEASLNNALTALKQRAAVVPIEPPKPQPVVRDAASSGETSPVQGNAVP